VDATHLLPETQHGMLEHPFVEAPAGEK